MRPPSPGSEYNLRGYGAMIADRVRMAAYREALARSVKPGDMVLDIGAGTGILSLLACQLGARKVHAVEPSDALAVARELAHANGFSDRIEFHYKTSFDVQLAEPADIMVSDLRGMLPLYGGHLPAIADARRRLLRPGGIQIPQRDMVVGQLVSDATLYEETLAIWRDRTLGLDLSAAVRWVNSAARKVDLAKSPLLGTPCPLFTLDYRALEAPDARGTAQWTADADATAHGLGVWFDATLVDGVGFSNAPDRPRAIYGQTFFPFSAPLALKRGDAVTATLAATRVGAEYVWRWDVAAGATTLKHSSFQGSPVDPNRLGRRAAGYVPRRTDSSRAAARALALMEQGLPVEQIAATLTREFPQRFQAQAAHEFVADLCDWLGD